MRSSAEAELPDGSALEVLQCRRDRVRDVRDATELGHLERAPERGAARCHDDEPLAALREREQHLQPRAAEEREARQVDDDRARCQREQPRLELPAFARSISPLSRMTGTGPVRSISTVAGPTAAGAGAGAPPGR